MTYQQLLEFLKLALKFKVETDEQYNAYLDELKDVRKELGVPLKEELFTAGNDQGTHAF